MTVTGGGDDVLITFSNGNTLLLSDTRASEITASAVIFV